MNIGINVGLQESMNHSNQYVGFPLYILTSGARWLTKSCWFGLKY